MIDRSRRALSKHSMMYEHANRLVDATTELKKQCIGQELNSMSTYDSITS